MNIFNIFKMPQTSPLPTFPTINLADIPPASTLLFYGGTKLTEWVGNRLYAYPYKPPAFHAAFYIEKGYLLNVGAFRTIHDLLGERQSTRRIDVIIYKNIPDATRAAMAHDAYLDTSQPHIGLDFPDYGWRGYLHFGLSFIKPGKEQFCSEQVVGQFGEFGVTVSNKAAEDTAPWDLQLFARANPDICEQRTYWIGQDFKT